MNTAQIQAARYDGVAILLHWLTALAIFALLTLGFVMTALPFADPLKFPLFQWHKSLGITVLGLSVLRLAWRLGHRPPPLPGGMPRLEQAVAHAGHAALYLLMFALPLSGWAAVSAAPFNIPTLLYGVLPLPHLPVLSTLADKKPVFDVIAEAHRLAAWALILTLAGHIGAALRHHFVLRDGVLTRMQPRFGRRS